MSPVDGLASEGLHGPRYGPEGLLAGPRRAAGTAVANGVVGEITIRPAVEAVPSPDGALVSGMIAAIVAAWTAELAGVLVHLLLRRSFRLILSTGRATSVHPRA